MRMSEKCRNNDNNSDTPLTSRHTDGGKNQAYGRLTCTQHQEIAARALGKKSCAYPPTERI